MPLGSRTPSAIGTLVLGGLAFLAASGCRTPFSTVAPGSVPSSRPAANPVPPPTTILQVQAETPTPKSLDELLHLTFERHPKLAQMGWAVESARGRALQAGLYPNPIVSITGDELGDVQGRGGIWTAPQVSQEIVLGSKLGLAQAAGMKQTDQARVAALAERYRLFTQVRIEYWAVVSLQTRVAVLTELLTLADRSVETAEKLLKAKEGSELDVVQLEVDRERYRADLDATRRALPGAMRSLAASVGVETLPEEAVRGTLDDPIPEYDLDRVTAAVVSQHPDVLAARLGVERARLALSRAEVEPIPNITLSAGYVRQNQNRSNDWVIGASLPVPLWNKNEGAIHAARAEVGEATAEVARVQYDLSNRVATAHATFAAARARADRYRTAILPKAETSLKLSRQAYLGGQFEYLRVLQAQRSLAEARLEFVQAQGEMWKAASELAGLMLEDPVPAVNPTRR